MNRISQRRADEILLAAYKTLRETEHLRKPPQPRQRGGTMIELGEEVIAELRAGTPMTFFEIRGIDDGRSSSPFAT
jgi:hypothetical protein